MIGIIFAVLLMLLLYGSITGSGTERKKTGLNSFGIFMLREFAGVLEENLYNIFTPCISFTGTGGHETHWLFQGQIDGIFPLYGYVIRDVREGETDGDAAFREILLAEAEEGICGELSDNIMKEREEVQEQPEEVQTADAVTTNRDTSQTEAPAIAEETDTATTITAAVTLQTEQPEQTTVETEGSGSAVYYTFRNDSLLDSHYEKHGIEMGFDSAEAYEAAANAVIADENALHKQEVEDGDDIYYLEDTNEFVVVSGDGYIRTYFEPSSGMAYYERQ